MFKLDKMSLCSNVCIYTIIKLENVRVYAHRETSNSIKCHYAAIQRNVTLNKIAMFVFTQ